MTLLNRHSIKLLSKSLSLYISATPRLYQKVSFYSGQTVPNTESLNQSKKQRVSVGRGPGLKCDIMVSITYCLHTSIQGWYKRGQKDFKSQRLGRTVFCAGQGHCIHELITAMASSVKYTQNQFQNGGEGGLRRPTPQVRSYGKLRVAGQGRATQHAHFVPKY